MSDWDKIISFSNSKQGGAIQFILVCVILVIMFGSHFRNQMGGKQRDGKQRGGKQRGGNEGLPIGFGLAGFVILVGLVAIIFYAVKI